jgi:hypothetical protein
VLSRFSAATPVSPHFRIVLRKFDRLGDPCFFVCFIFRFANRRLLQLQATVFFSPQSQMAEAAAAALQAQITVAVTAALAAQVAAARPIAVASVAIKLPDFWLG